MFLPPCVGARTFSSPSLWYHKRYKFLVTPPCILVLNPSIPCYTRLDFPGIVTTLRLNILTVMGTGDAILSGRQMSWNNICGLGILCRNLARADLPRCGKKWMSELEMRDIEDQSDLDDEGN